MSIKEAGVRFLIPAVIGFVFGWVFSDEILIVARWILG